MSIAGTQMRIQYANHSHTALLLAVRRRHLPTPPPQRLKLVVEERLRYFSKTAHANDLAPFPELKVLR